MSTLVAAGVSVLLGFLDTRPRDYRYWRFWARGPFRLAVMAMLVLYGAAGLGAFAIFHVAGAHSGAAISALSGAAGNAVVRADATPGLSSASIAGRLRRWLTDWLDDIAQDRIDRRVSGLSGQELVALTFRLFRRHAELAARDPSFAKINAERSKLYLQAASDLDDLHSRVAEDARAILEVFCAFEMSDRRIIYR